MDTNQDEGFTKRQVSNWTRSSLSLITKPSSLSSIEASFRFPPFGPHLAIRNSRLIFSEGGLIFMDFLRSRGWSSPFVGLHPINLPP